MKYRKLTKEQHTLKLRFKDVCRKVTQKYGNDCWNNPEARQEIYSHFTWDERVELTKNCGVCAMTNEEYAEWKKS